MNLKISLLYCFWMIPFLFYGQGFKKFYKPPGFNFRAPIGLIHNKIDPSCFFLRGQPGSITVEIGTIDTNGDENIIHLVQHDSLKAITGITKGANHACDGHFENELTFVSQIFKPLEINVYSYNTISQKLSTFRFTPPIDLVNLRVFNIIKVKDGYLVTGDWVIPGEHPRGYIVTVRATTYP